MKIIFKIMMLYNNKGRDLCKKVLPPTAETKTKIFSCFHPKSLLIRLKYPLNPPWIPD